MTWPWVLHLRDAVADRGDPYMISWTLWWDYHQTFHNPLHLFDANVFYPYKYTLAFSENDYGIALLFFPLFAAGLRALTVSSVATFLGFAFCGYGAFRLTRTLTGSNGAAWVAGIVFAFVPFRFHVLSHLHYLFAGWIPLLLEAFILFARERSWRRAAWLGAAFTMNALSCVSWFIMVLIPLALTAALVIARRPTLRRDHAFWLRGGVALGAAALIILPFLIPYYVVSVKYGLRWQPWEFALNSPQPIHWLAAEGRNKLWHNLGTQIPGGHKLFPGLLAPLLALAALRLSLHPREEARGNFESRPRRRFIIALDCAIVLAGIVAALALGYGDVTYRVFGHQLVRLGARSVDHALVVISVALVLRFWLSPPQFFHTARKERPEREHESESPATEDSAVSEASARSARHASRPVFGDGDAISIALIWTAWGFLSSLGANLFLNRWLHDYVLLFQSIRLPSRWAMICYVGLAVLAGIGASRLACRASRVVPRQRVATLVFALVASALVFELRAFPLRVERGEIEPTALALRLKRTEMRGGLVELPSEEGLSRHFYMLRAVDHERPLVNATSSFLSPATIEINDATRGHPRQSFLDLLEKIPASYLVINNDRLPPEGRADYQTFLARAVASGRLRFVNRFDDAADLYAVVKTEPEARSEAALPFKLGLGQWATLIDDDPLSLLGPYLNWTQELYRVMLVAEGKLPRYAEFREDAQIVGKNLYELDEGRFRNNLYHLVGDLAVIKAYPSGSEGQFIQRLTNNAGIVLPEPRRIELANDLVAKRETRAGVLLKIANEPELLAREDDRSVVLLHYFAYLHRNPGEPPERNMDGFNYWIGEVKKHGANDLANAFSSSLEFRARSQARMPK